VTIDYLVKNTTVKMIIEADRLWFINKVRAGRGPWAVGRGPWAVRVSMAV
jgi:hypothetical protein